MAAAKKSGSAKKLKDIPASKTVKGGRASEASRK